MEFFITIVVIGFLIHYEMLRQNRKKLEIFYNKYVLSIIDNFLTENPQFKKTGHWHSEKQKISQIILFSNAEGRNFLQEVGCPDSLVFRHFTEDKINSGEYKLIRRIYLDDYKLFSL
jgi:hypothetical protein